MSGGHSQIGRLLASKTKEVGYKINYVCICYLSQEYRL
jgi:hypothetical protein